MVQIDLQQLILIKFLCTPLPHWMPDIYTRRSTNQTHEQWIFICTLQCSPAIRHTKSVNHSSCNRISCYLFYRMQDMTSSCYMYHKIDLTCLPTTKWNIWYEEAKSIELYSKVIVQYVATTKVSNHFG